MTVIGQIPAKVASYIRPYWRWRWTGLWTAWILATAGWIGVSVLPDRFEGMTRVYVETDNLLKPLLQNIAIQADIQQQLEVLQRTLLNRTNIIHVAHAADLDLDAETEADKEAIYDRILKRIGIKAEGRNIFTVTFTDTDPRLAKKVVETLLNIFVEANLGLNRSGIETARNFIESQIADYEQKLKLADLRQADFKLKHGDILAATGANFASRLDAANQEQQTARAHRDDLVAVRDQLKASLASTPPQIDVDMAPQVMVSSGGDAPAATARGRVAQAEAQLSRLEARYTSNHPDVVAAKRALAQAQAAAAHEEKTPGAPAAGGRNHISNPVYEQIKLRLIQAESDVTQADHHVELATQEYQRLKQLSDTAPKIEAELADLNRDYGVVKTKFEELLARREAARISQAVEASDDKLHFRVIEAPQVPVLPVFPNRPVFLSGVLVLALGVGGGLMVLLQMIDGTIGSLAELSTEFNIPVLAVVPLVEHASSIYTRQRGQRRFAAALALLIVAYVAIVLLNHFVNIAGLIPSENLPMLLQRIRSYAG